MIGYVVSYKALAIIVLGGLGSVRGTLIASLVLGLVEAYGTIFIGSWLNRDAIAFLALIALLMITAPGPYRSARGMSAYEISLLSVIGINVMLAVSLNMISGFCGQISLGHGAFYGAGAYAAALIMIATRNVPLALVSAAAVAALLGMVVGFASLARAQRLPRRDHDRRQFPVHRLRAQAGVARRRDGHQRHSGVGSRRRRQHGR